MQYVIQSGGKQYIVGPQGEVVVDRLPVNVGESVQMSVIAMIDGDKTQGSLKKTSTVPATVIEHLRGEKIRVSTFKAKVRTRKTIGFRSSLTKVKIGDMKASKAS